MYNPFRPKPAPPAFGAGKVLPEQNANILSKVFFFWLSPFLSVGFSRPLEKDDLWELPDKRLAANVTEEFEASFYARCPKEKRPPFLRDSFPEPKTPAKKAEKPKEKAGSEAANALPPLAGAMVAALHSTFFFQWWTAGILQLFSDTLKTTTPLLNKVLLTWLADSYVWYRLTDQEKAEATTAGLISQPKGIGYGIGLAIGLFAMQEASSLLVNHAMQIGMRNGLLIRTAIIGNIFRKSLRLSGKARQDHSVGQITTLISADATRFDILTHLAHHLWIAPIQLILGFGLLIGTLGYSALVGLGVLIIGLPIQVVLVNVLLTQRGKAVKITDMRVRLVTEVLQGIRLVKLYGWEKYYIGRLQEMRERELKAVRQYSISAAALMGMFFSLPSIATIMSFITYSLTGHDLNVATIFTSLMFFNIIRTPLILLPLSLSLLADSLVAVGRITKFLTADELVNEAVLDNNAKNAIQIDGDFAWETVGKAVQSKEESPEDSLRATLRKREEKEREKREKKERKKAKKEGKDLLPVTQPKEEEKQPDKDENEKPFELKNLNLTIPRGSFVAIVGSVASGKSSILQALIGEMRRTRGEVVFSGPVAYVPQAPWIRNVTVRQNILFGQEEDEKRLQTTIEACGLQHDIEVLPQGIETEIGEKGINLSGGQKARISLARAAYSSADIVLMDDPLSAVDAHVGRGIIDHCFLSGPLANRTRVLVTHALHVLDKTDYIYVMESGEIKEHGTFDALMQGGQLFSRLMEEYGNLETRDVKSTRGIEKASEDTEPSSVTPTSTALMHEEDRFVGSVPWTVYRDYLRAAGSSFAWTSIILVLLALAQASQVGENLFLSFWTTDSISGFTDGKYMAVYAGLGVANGVFVFLLSMAFSFVTILSSLKLFKVALRHVLRSPLSFFDRTPMGRVLNRLSKDQDTLDNELSMIMLNFALCLSGVLGTAGLVFYTFPLLGIIFAPMAILYGIASVYYRRTSVETKRLDSILRSTLYSSFSETFTGLATIRAYRETTRAVKDADYGIDLENRAYYMTISIQRWLAVRLDLFGNFLILGIALFAAGFRNTANPAKTGLVLSYALGITQLFSEMVSQFAQIEQSMNAAERVLVYTELPPEGPASTPNDPPPSWPEKGVIKFTGVNLRYRERLPLVLKNINFEVSAGEKIGICGRTGAGKTSLLQALFRTVELEEGKIEIDGKNIAEMGLDVLRERLALVPQDTVLFQGTLRQNLDPQGTRTDAELISVLQKAWLLPREGTQDPAAEAKFSLDATVGDDGSNFSAGEKQLLALSRALVKNSRVIVLDEATSAIDLETDAKLQITIQTEFASSTLLCIAHRLNTIAYYDRVLVMDEGEVAEFDTVLNLYDKEDSIFRSLCKQASLSRSDILRIRAEHKHILEQLN